MNWRRLKPSRWGWPVTICKYCTHSARHYSSRPDDCKAVVLKAGKLDYVTGTYKERIYASCAAINTDGNCPFFQVIW